MCICLYLSFFLSVEKDASDSDRAYYREAVANLPETESFMLLFFFQDWKVVAGLVKQVLEAFPRLKVTNGRMVGA